MTDNEIQQRAEIANGVQATCSPDEHYLPPGDKHLLFFLVDGGADGRAKFLVITPCRHGGYYYTCPEWDTVGELSLVGNRLPVQADEVIRLARTMVDANWDRVVHDTGFGFDAAPWDFHREMYLDEKGWANRGKTADVAVVRRHFNEDQRAVLAAYYADILGELWKTRIPNKKRRKDTSLGWASAVFFDRQPPKDSYYLPPKGKHLLFLGPEGQWVQVTPSNHADYYFSTHLEGNELVGNRRPILKRRFANSIRRLVGDDWKRMVRVAGMIGGRAPWTYHEGLYDSDEESTRARLARQGD